MDTRTALIDWDYSGQPDGFFGTGATTTEQTLVYAGAFVSTAILAWAVWSQSIAWTWWQYAIALLLALDIFGGVAANSLNSCKRFYHSPIKPEETGFTALANNHLTFTAFHIHPLLVGLLFGSMNWVYGITWYAMLVSSSFLVLKTPLYLQRPMAMGIIMIAVLLNFYLIQPVPGFEWLVPALFLKIVYGHIVREEPYRKE